MKNRLLLFFILLSTVFTDLPLSKIIGTIGLSPMFIVATVGFIFFTIKKRGRIWNRPDIALFLNYYLISLFSSVFIAVYYFFENKTLYSPYGNFIPIKLIDASFYNLVYYFLYVCLAELLKSEDENIRFFVLGIFLMIISAGFLELLNPNYLEVFHSVVVHYERLRLLEAEPSRACLVLNVFGMLSLFYARSKGLRLLLIINIIVFNFLISSKGGLVFVFLAVILTFTFNTTVKTKIYGFLGFVILLIVGSIVLFKIVLPAMVVDLTRFSSISTRTVTSIWAMISLIKFPFGEGYGTYLCFFQKPLIHAMTLVSNLSPVPLGMGEIHQMINTGKDVGVKSGILFQVVQNGWIAVVFYFFLFKNALKRIKYLLIPNRNKMILYVLVYYVLLTALLGANIAVLYAYVLPIAVINNIYYRGG